MNNNEPVVLGKVKKGKTGNPVIVIIVFLFIGAIVLFLPTIMNYFGDYNVIDLIKNGQIIDFFQNHDAYINKSNTPITTTTQKVEDDKEKLINNKTIIEYSNFTLTNFDLKKDSITFNIKTSNTIDFDKSNYYLVLSKNDKEISTLKIVGKVSNEDTFTLVFNKKIDSIVEVYGIVKEIKKEDFPNVTLHSDESGLATITCTNSNNKIEYTFQSSKLINIKDTFTYVDKNDGEYYTTFEEYNKKSIELNNIGAISNIAEYSTNFVMITDIDLNTYQYSNNKDNNYYSLNTDAKVINFEMEAKGFDCK